MLRPAFVYLRVSGKKQITGSGFNRQLDTVERFVKGTGYKIEGIYKEQISGTKDETTRPEFSAMVTEILANGIDTVVVESLDRLAREYRIQEQLLIYLVSKGINVVAANTGENITEAVNSDPMRKAMIQIQGIFAELDKNQLVARLRKGRDKVRKEKGRCEGPRPYGSTPEEAKVLHRIGCMRRKPRAKNMKQRTFQSIADQLNEEGIPTRQGKKWDAALVYNVWKKGKKRKLKS